MYRQTLNKIDPNDHSLEEMTRAKLTSWLSFSLILLFTLTLWGCGGKGAARDELSQTRTLLESVRKTGCAHPSMSLAEQAYAKSQRLFDEKKYEDARTQAAVARQLANEAAAELKAKPCEVPPPPPPPSVVKPEEERAEDANVTPFAAEPTASLKTVYFDFDSVAFSPEAIQVLEANLEWLKAHPDQEIVLSGHCDERGTTEYNMALGDKRARKVSQYLQQANIQEKRIEIVSLGSESPASFRRDEEGYRLNRRVEFSLARRLNPEE